jgi:hypothetical protein
MGAVLRTDYPHVLREPVPKVMAELLRQVDQPPESSSKQASRKPANDGANRKESARGFADAAE